MCLLVWTEKKHQKNFTDKKSLSNVGVQNVRVCFLVCVELQARCYGRDISPDLT